MRLFRKEPKNKSVRAWPKEDNIILIGYVDDDAARAQQLELCIA